MRLRHVLLVLLAERPQTGYEISRRMRETVALFWRAQHSQIYPELRALADAGLVTHEATSGPGPREKKTYTITAAGRAELREWLASAYTPAAPKDELVARAFAAASADPSALAAVFAAEADRQDGRLAHLEQLQAETEASPASADPRRPEFGWALALLSGTGAARHRRDWCREVARRLDAAAADRTDPEQPR